MDYHIDQYSRLVITGDEKWRTECAEYSDHRLLLEDVEDAMREIMIRNGTFMDISPAVCGDLTDAPMIGILGEVEPGIGYPDRRLKYDGVGCGYVSESTSYTSMNSKHNTRAKVRARWAYMNYAVTDWREELVETGCIVWEGGFVDRDNDAGELAQLANCELIESR